MVELGFGNKVPFRVILTTVILLYCTVVSGVLEAKDVQGPEKEGNYLGGKRKIFFILYIKLNYGVVMGKNSVGILIKTKSNP